LFPCLAFAEEASQDLTNCQGTVFVADNELATEECTEGNLFSAGMDLKDQSKVKGIGFLAGNTLNIDGQYEFGVHLGNMVTISGAYEKDLFVAGNFVTIEKDAKINGDLYVAASSLVIETELNNAYIAAESVTINANIAGDVKITAATIEVNEGAKIAGKILYNEDAVLAVKEGFAAETETYKSEEYTINHFEAKVSNLVLTIGGSLVILIIALALVPNVFEKYLERAKNFKTSNELMTALRGLGVLVGAPILAIVLLITVIGVIAGISLGLIYGVCLLVATPVAGYFIGGLILKAKKEEKFGYKILRGLVGIVIISALSLVPYLGGWVSFIALIWGLGLLFEATPLYKKK